MVLVKVKSTSREKSKFVPSTCSSSKVLYSGPGNFPLKLTNYKFEPKLLFQKEVYHTPKTVHKILLFPYWKSLDRMLRRTSQTTDTIICILCSLNLLLNGRKEIVSM